MEEGYLNVTFAGRNTGYAKVSIIGNNGKTYLSNSTDAWGYCFETIQNFTVYLPAQNYTIRLRSGNGDGACGNAFISLNQENTIP